MTPLTDDIDWRACSITCPLASANRWKQLINNRKQVVSMKTTKEQAREIFYQEVGTAKALGFSDIAREGWTFGFNRRARGVGLCRYTLKKIELSVYFMDTNGPETLRQTIKHEIAHALCPGDKHGAKWKETFIKLGGNGQRLNTIVQMSSQMPKWALIDTTQGGVVVATYFKKPRRNPARLSIKGRPETRGKLKLVKASQVEITGT